MSLTESPFDRCVKWTKPRAQKMLENLWYYTRVAFCYWCGRKLPKRDLSKRFPGGFRTPFNSPQGVIHEVFAIEDLDESGWVRIHGNGQGVKVGVYQIKAELEVLADVGEAEEYFSEFASDPLLYLMKHPCSPTKRVVRCVWVTDSELAEQAVAIQSQED